MATWRKWTSTVLVNGQPEPNVKIYVYEPGTTNEIPIYEDEGITPIAQPILTDSQGRYAFFVDVSTYPEIRLYLEKDGVDFSEANEDLDGVPVPGAGGGAGTFLELTDTPSSYVGRGGDVVVVKTSEDGIETQPWPVTGTVLNVFLSDDAADVGNYYYMYPSETGGSATELTSSSLSTGDDQLLWSFVTEVGEPGIDQLALGVYTATLFLKKTGNKDARLYWKLFKRDTGGTETEILQSAVSDYLTSDNSQYLISGYLNEDQALDPTDRLVLKLYANVSGTGTDVTVTLTMEGDYDSRLAIHVLSSAFDLDRLSDVTISSPSDNQMLAYDAGSGKWTNQTPEEAGILASDGSVPLTGDWDTGGFRISNLKSLNFEDATTLTISSGAVTVSQSYHYVDTEGGASADDLDTINGGTAGDILYLRSTDSSHTVVIKHGTGNIVTPDGNDYSLDSTDKVVALLFDGTNWHLVGAAGGGTGGASTFLGLTDTPSSYAGYAKYSPMIKDDETGLGWQSFADMELESRTIYVDADNGSDTTGDGSEGNPFQTYEKALSTVRNVIADGVTITIHLKAATATYTPVTTGRLCIGSGKLLVKGELTSLVETTCTGGTATTIVKSGAGWTENAYQRKLVKFTHGGTDYWRIIESNTSDTLTVIGRLDVTPSDGDSFVIYDWASTFAGASMDIVACVVEFEDCAFQVPIALSAPNCVVTLTRCEVIPSESYDKLSVIGQYSDLCFLTLETCVLLRNSVVRFSIRFLDYASGYFMISRSFLGGSPSQSGREVIVVSGAGVGYWIRNGTIIDGTGSGPGILSKRGAIGLFYSGAVNGAVDKITIKNCTDHGIYVDTASGIEYVGTAYVNYSGNDTDYAANSSLYAWYRT